MPRQARNTRPKPPPPAPAKHVPTSRLGHRVAQLHDRLLASYATLEQVADRKAPAPPDVTAAIAPLLARARLLLSRHPLESEVPPLPAGEAVMPGELFVRVTRAVLALGTLFEELVDLSPRERGGL